MQLPKLHFVCKQNKYNGQVVIVNKTGAVGVKMPAIMMCLSLGWKVTPRGFFIWPFINEHKQIQKHDAKIV